VRLVLCMFTLWLPACGSDDAGRGAPGPALVRVAQAQAGALTDSWTTVGDVVALDQAELAAGAQGPVSRVTVREGDRVEAGALLLQVDPSIALADHSAARAAGDEAAAELARLEAAFERRRQVRQGVVSDEELVNARQAVLAARARLDARRADARRSGAVLARHRIEAPFSGVVVARQVDVGDWVQVGVPVLTVVSMDAVEVRAQVPQAIAARLRPDMPVGLGSVTQDSGSGVVAAVVPTLDAHTRTSLVRITPSADTRLVAGQAVDVRVPVTFDDPGVTVPRDALIADPEQARLVRVVDGKAEMLAVDVLATTASEALVTGEGLDAGDTVVVRGNERVRPGQDVRIEEGS